MEKIGIDCINIIYDYKLQLEKADHENNIKPSLYQLPYKRINFIRNVSGYYTDGYTMCRVCGEFILNQRLCGCNKYFEYKFYSQYYNGKNRN